MTRNIGIVGAGIAGLHLALYLQKPGVEATLITDRTPEDYRKIRLINTVAHHHVMLTRENYLGVSHWSAPEFHYYYHDHFFNFPQPLTFRGYFSKSHLSATTTIARHSCARCWRSWRSIIRRPTIGSIPRALISLNPRISFRQVSCRRSATRLSSSTMANAPLRWETFIPSLTR